MKPTLYRLNAEEIRDCLSCDPFEGDFGDTSDRVLQDKIVVVRKKRTCSLCAGKVGPGQHARVQNAVVDGHLWGHTWCFHCCKAMAKSAEDDGNAYEFRAELGITRTSRRKCT